MNYDNLASTYYLLGYQRAVEQVALQAGCSHEDATDLMMDCAHAERCSLGDLALAVIDGRVRFDIAALARESLTG